MSAKRKKNPRIEAEVMFLAHMQCCFCQSRGAHIHHIDGNPQNTVLDNLVLLCFEHHHEAEVKGGLKRGLSPELLRKYRDHHYEAIAKQRTQTIKGLDRPVRKISTGSLVDANLTAMTLLEIVRIERAYYEADWGKRVDLLDELHALAKFNNLRVSYAVMEFLSGAAHLTRSGMPASNGLAIWSVVAAFFPARAAGSPRQIREVAKLSIDVGLSIVYDAAIHLGEISSMLPGLTILKSTFLTARRNKLPNVQQDVNDAFVQLKAHLNRPGRKDLEVFSELLADYMAGLSDSDLSYPVFSPNVMRALYPDEV